MNFNLLILSFSINIIISIGIPIGVLIYIIMRKRQYLKSYLIGSIIFFISQIILRLPLLNFLNLKSDWFMMLSSLSPIVYSAILGLSAGIFEEVGRFLGFKWCLNNNSSYKDGLAFGIGHGGIEAIIITGMASIQNLIIIISLKSGNFNAVKYGISLEEATGIYNSTSGFMVLLGGFERLFAMCIHIALTMIVLYGINKKKKRYLLLAIILHGVVDSMLGILQYFGVGIIGIEIWVFICAIISVIFTVGCKKYFKGNNLPI